MFHAKNEEHAASPNSTHKALSPPSSTPTGLPKMNQEQNM